MLEVVTVGLPTDGVVVASGHQVGFFVGHVVAEDGFLVGLVLIGFRVECVDRSGEDGWVGSGGIV